MDRLQSELRNWKDDAQVQSAGDGILRRADALRDRWEQEVQQSADGEQE